MRLYCHLLTEDEIHKIAALEQSHWWYRGTRDVCFDLLDPFIRDHPQLEILDVGCGTGGNLLTLSQYGHARGIDIDPLCVEYCRRKGLEVSTGTMSDLHQPPASLGLLTMFDVLCQAEPGDTVPILRGMADVLRPGGVIAFREPAMPVARGWHDRAVNIRQRFTATATAATLREAGFEPLRVTYLNTFLFPPIVVLRRLQDLRRAGHAKSDVEATPEPLNSLLLGLLHLERTLLRTMNLPFGVSLFAIARRR